MNIRKAIATLATLMAGASALGAQNVVDHMAKVHDKAEHMAAIDPHGWTITVVSVSVVFSALIILYVAYTLVGRACNGRPHLPKRKKKSKSGDVPDEVAAAISLALRMSGGNETEAAIALALDRYLNEAVHDYEPYVITIRRK